MAAQPEYIIEMLLAVGDQVVEASTGFGLTSEAQQRQSLIEDLVRLLIVVVDRCGRLAVPRGV